MTFQPFGSLVLVEKLDIKEEIKKATNIIMHDAYEGRFWKVRVISKGPMVPEGIGVRDVCMANPLPAVDANPEKAFGDPKYVLIQAHDLLGRWNE